MNRNKSYAEIEKRLRSLIFKERTANFFLSGIRWFTATVVLFLFFTMIEALFRFSSSGRTIIILLFAFFVLAVFLFICGKSILPLFKKIRLNDLISRAELIGMKNRKVKDELANVLDLVSGEYNDFSADLIEAAFVRALDLLSDDDLKFNPRNYLSGLRDAAFIVLTGLIFLMLIPPLKSAANRLINYDVEFVPPPEFSITLQPEKSVVIKGDSLLINVSGAGNLPARIFIYEKDADQTEFEKLKSLPIRDKKGSFWKRKIFLSFEMYAKAGEALSDTISVKVINPPVIKGFTVEIFPPEYTREKSFKQYDNGNLTALKGSRVFFSGRTNKKLDSCRIEFKSQKPVPLKVNGEKFYGRIKLKKNGSYRIRVKDSAGNMNRFPIEYSIELTDDAYPKLEVIEPEKDIELGNEDVIPAILKISDDYGFSKLTLNYKLSASEFKKPSEKFTSLSIPINKRETEEDVFYEWSLRPLKIEVNDRYLFYFELFDNDYVSGPKSVKSKTFSLFLPPLEDFLAKSEKEQNQSVKKLEKTLKEAEKLKTELRKLSAELKKNKAKISWEEKEKLKKAAEKLQKLAEKSEKLKKEISEQKKELQKKNVLSEKTLKKYSELQKLMSEIKSETLKKALEKMQSKLENMMRDDAQKAMEELKKNEEAFRKSLERTISLFKRILAEQKMDELVKRTSEIEKAQKKISDAVKRDSAGKKRDELTQKQADLSKRLKELEKKSKELSEMLSKMEDMPKEEMKKLSEELENQKNPELSQKAAENMMEDKVRQAMQNQQKLMKNLKQMSQKMKNMQSMMSGQMQRKVMTEMARIIQELVKLSKQEEALKQETGSNSLDNKRSKEISEKQNNLLNDMDTILKQMNSLSKKTFAITPEMGKALGKAKNNMRGAISSALDKNGRNAMWNQQSAMAALNDAANMMSAMMNQMANGQGGGGMMSLSQQLKKMAGEQMQLNQMTQQMKGGGMSMKQAAMMKRLAGRQEAIRKSLEELNREAKASGKSKKIASNLERVLEQMKEVVSDLQSQNLDDGLIKKQQNILSRLLDAQRSVNDRDYEKKRESESGRTWSRKSPGKIDFSKKENKTNLEKELLKAEQEGYSRDYKELIKKYYRSLKEK